VQYVDESIEEARTRLRSEGFPDWHIDSQLALTSYQRTGGETARLTRDVYELTGHAPRSMAQFAYEYQDAFAAPTAGERADQNAP
jgi:hypothetical protein